ncbi:hypothetical protein WT83_27900 [Burkholderia territorii]|uniref:Uncharacterized protein n=1 Tax=Burkholderia territorii TaxID=1503055 RepID=A0A108E756_9BURK|nr:hypothetical protein [Burkholderia territorii]KWN05906.1 hypothetical protein WT83_27900 [Burkholderia territorii]
MDKVETTKLTKHRLRSEMEERHGHYLWLRRAGCQKAERVACILDYRKLRSRLLAGDYINEVNARGNVVHRDRDADATMGFRGGSRYAYDFRILQDGWQQYDTEQDASYFGCWVHIERRLTMCYAEGDRILVECPTLESFRAELADMERFYGPAPAAFTVIDPDKRTLTKVYTARPALPADPNAPALSA